MNLIHLFLPSCAQIQLLKMEIPGNCKGKQFFNLFKVLRIALQVFYCYYYIYALCNTFCIVRKGICYFKLYFAHILSKLLNKKSPSTTLVLNFIHCVIFLYYYLTFLLKHIPWKNFPYYSLLYKICKHLFRNTNLINVQQAVINSITEKISNSFQGLYYLNFIHLFLK